MRQLLFIFLFGSLVLSGQSQSLMVSGWYQDSLFSKTVEPRNIAPNDTLWLSASIEITDTYYPNFLEIGPWGEVVVYKDQAIIGKSGRMLPMSSRSYASHRNLIRIDESGGYRIKVIKSYPLETSPAIDQVKILSYESLRDQENWRLIGQSIFFGLILVMSFYNLMIYVSVKDQSYLYYVLSILGIGIYLFFFYGFSIEYIWPESPRWDVHFYALIIPLTNISRILFTKSYLLTRQHTPVWNKFLNGLLIVYFLPLGLWAFNYSGWLNLLNETNSIIGLLGTTVMTSITILSIVIYRKGYKPALWFLIAYLLFNIGGVLFIFRELGYLPDNFFTRYLLQYGVAAQVILFSLGLASRLNQTRKKLSDEIIQKEKLRRKQEIEKKEIIEQQRNQLEQKVKERTQELELLLDKISHSENKLRELNALKDRLFSIISHDLKSPLTTVDSFLNLLLNHHQKMTDEEFAVVSNKTKFALQNLSLLLDNLLHWSRLQQNYVSFNPVRTAILPLVEKNIKLFRLLLEEKQLRLQVKEAQLDHEVWVDRDMIDFVVRNVLHNAIKFSPKNSRIEIEGAMLEDYLSVKITNQGVGMTQKEISQILEQGESFTKTGTEKEKGTGIGLLMCKDFIERNGGHMEITSHPQGTAVSFTAPLVGVVA